MGLVVRRGKQLDVFSMAEDGQAHSPGLNNSSLALKGVSVSVSVTRQPYMLREHTWKGQVNVSLIESPRETLGAKCVQCRLKTVRPCPVVS